MGSLSRKSLPTRLLRRTSESPVSEGAEQGINSQALYLTWASAGETSLYARRGHGPPPTDLLCATGRSQAISRLEQHQQQQQQQQVTEQATALVKQQAPSHSFRRAAAFAAAAGEAIF
ncbi:hypothetical protein Efla_006121 [Eimeria flavescens]